MSITAEKERQLAQNPLLWTKFDCAHWLAARYVLELSTVEQALMTMACRECFEAADTVKHRDVNGKPWGWLSGEEGVKVWGGAKMVPRWPCQ